MHQNLDPFGLNKTLSQTVQDFGFHTGHLVGATLPLACVVCVAAAVSQTDRRCCGDGDYAGRRASSDSSASWSETRERVYIHR